jgi:hypothetical protein
MAPSLLFFYGLLISAMLTTGVVVYVKAVFKESKDNKINHSNYGCG